jgi:ABC-2 type transport system permease protein
MLALAVVGAAAAAVLLTVTLAGDATQRLLLAPLILVAIPLAAFGLGVLGHPSDVLDGRRLGVLGVGPARAATQTLLLGFLHPTAVIALVPYGAFWLARREELEAGTALGLAALGWAGCVLAHRIGTRVGRVVTARRTTREVGAVFWYLVTLVASTLAFALLFLPWREVLDDAIDAIAAVVEWIPAGNLALAGRDEATDVIVLINAAVVAVLGIATWLIERRDVTRSMFARGHGGRVQLGVLRAAPGSATWAIAARTWLSWLRDSRYRLSLITVAILPPLLVFPSWIAGVGSAELVLLPVPIFALLFGWALHNDTAYDSTALWLHATGGLPGRADRLGRAIPTLVTGVVLISVGGLLVWWVTSDPQRAVLVATTSLALLGVGVGGSSIMSAVAPYPVARPGDSPWSQPVSSWGGSFAVHGISLVVELALCGPAIWFGVVALLSVDWNDVWLAAGLGVATGVAVCALGVLLGGQVFTARRTRLLNTATLVD